MSWRTAWIASCLSLAAASCGGGGGGQNCTLIGCFSSVTVKLGTPAPSLPYRVAITADGKQQAFACDVNGPRDEVGVTVIRCDRNGFDLGGTPAKLDVVVTVGSPDDGGAGNDDGGGAGDGGSGSGYRAAGSFTPTYATTQPNGPSCPPTCMQATVTLP